MTCEFCNSPVHIWFDCPKKPAGWKPERLRKKSTAARKDVLGEQQSGSRSNVAATVALEAIKPEAGTQAPPVDIKSLSANLAVAEAALKDAMSKPKYKDRHKPGYQAQKQREYRALKKAKPTSILS